MLATESQSHLEWHRNANVPVGLSCPWDACDPGALDDSEVDRLLAIQAANKAAEEEWLESAEAQAVCEHGMSQWLCAGPGHYPQDDPFDW